VVRLLAVGQASDRSSGRRKEVALRPFLASLAVILTACDATGRADGDVAAQTPSSLARSIGQTGELAKAEEAIAAGHPWRATQIVAPVLRDPKQRTPAALLVASRAAAGWGGWAEVDKLFTNPPTSTEQMLHPDTKLYPKRDEPKKITLPKLKGYTETYGDVAGELGLRIYFLLWNKPVAETAAAGWDGDKWSVMTAKDGTDVGVSVSTWDSKAEAKEFADEYQKTIAIRFPKGERKVWVEQKGSNVYIVDGGTDAKLIKTLEKGAKIK